MWSSHIIPSHTSSIHKSINSISSFILIQWIPGNSVTPCNGLAYKASFCFSLQLYTGDKRIDPRRSIYTRPRCISLLTPKGFSRLQINQEQKRWRTGCSFTIRSPSISSWARSKSRSNLPEMNKTSITGFANALQVTP